MRLKSYTTIFVSDYIKIFPSWCSITVCNRINSIHILIGIRRDILSNFNRFNGDFNGVFFTNITAGYISKTGCIRHMHNIICTWSSTTISMVNCGIPKWVHPSVVGMPCIAWNTRWIIAYDHSSMLYAWTKVEENNISYTDFHIPGYPNACFVFLTINRVSTRKAAWIIAFLLSQVVKKICGNSPRMAVWFTFTICCKISLLRYSTSNRNTLRYKICTIFVIKSIRRIMVALIISIFVRIANHIMYFIYIFIYCIIGRSRGHKAWYYQRKN